MTLIVCVISTSFIHIPGGWIISLLLKSSLRVNYYCFCITLTLANDFVENILLKWEFFRSMELETSTVQSTKHLVIFWNKTSDFLLNSARNASHLKYRIRYEIYCIYNLIMMINLSSNVCLLLEEQKKFYYLRFNFNFNWKSLLTYNIWIFIVLNSIL